MVLARESALKTQMGGSLKEKQALTIVATTSTMLLIIHDELRPLLLEACVKVDLSKARYR